MAAFFSSCFGRSSRDASDSRAGLRASTRELLDELQHGQPSFDWLRNGGEASSGSGPPLEFHAVLQATRLQAAEDAAATCSADNVFEAAGTDRAQESASDLCGSPAELLDGITHLAWCGLDGGDNVVGVFQGAPANLQFVLSDASSPQLPREVALRTHMDHPHVLATLASRSVILDARYFQDMEVDEHAALAAYLQHDAVLVVHEASSDEPFAPCSQPCDAHGNVPTSLPDVLEALGARPGQRLSLLVTEVLDAGTLQSQVTLGFFRPRSGHHSEPVVLRSMLRCAHEVALGLEHLHSHGVIHRAVSPANVALRMRLDDHRGFECKLAEFGLARDSPGSMSNSLLAASDMECGLLYMAPEQFRGRVGKASDVWSFGVLLWTLVHDEAPYATCSTAQVMDGVACWRLRPHWRAVGFPPALRALVDDCLAYDPRLRPCMSEVVERLVSIEGQVCEEMAHRRARERSQAASRSRSCTNSPRRATAASGDAELAADKALAGHGAPAASGEPYCRAPAVRLQGDREQSLLADDIAAALGSQSDQSPDSQRHGSKAFFRMKSQYSRQFSTLPHDDGEKFVGSFE